MSDDKHPDHHFDDDFISQLYDASKEEMQPSSGMDELIFAQLKAPPLAGVGANVDNTGGDLGVNVTTLITPKKAFKKKWFVPNSLVACLVVSVMVGLIYRENADKLLISDPMELDYAIPMPSAERSVTSKPKVRVSDEEKEIQESPLLMDRASSLTELRPEVQGLSAQNVGAMVIEKQEIVEKEPSTQNFSGEVVSSALVESKKMAERKAKKSKPNVLMQKVLPSRMLMMAPPIQAEEDAYDAIDFDVEFNKIRKLIDEGDTPGARALLGALIAKYPSMELPADIVLLNKGE